MPVIRRRGDLQSGRHLGQETQMQRSFGGWVEEEPVFSKKTGS